ncbi:N-acetylmuramoyl-L-alanine amidase [Neobacillus niacini]|uniref:N-acetylmuramoyl-L-alanine amidase n=1 Tax=Neobacillus niacini TaxID=86668 RepID=UPI0021CB517D|nr:N-acetylmuramoyl-L-alanine amidase [Neobacillus niacini]MCM3765631.1 N-acetylmuramoyl-L-alanine amidase [Neobacillus niacini]
MAKKIMWDPGHGGIDPGAVANGLQESKLTLKIVQYAMTFLESYYYGFEQRATRITDVTVELFRRDDSANAWPADVFVSVHINAGGGTGFESYVYNGASPSSITLQNMIHAEVLAAMRQYGSITDRGKKRANFAVLRTTNMPSILTENLFIDSGDANRLKDEAFIKGIGEAHARGVAKFLGLPEKAGAPKPLAAVTVEPNFYSFTSGPIAKVRVIADNVNIYSAPDFNSAVVRQALIGEEFDVYTNQNDWHNVGGAHWIKGNQNGVQQLTLIGFRVIVDNLSYGQARDLVPELQKRFGGNSVWGEPK